MTAARLPALLALSVTLALGPASVQAATRVYVLAIGNNALPVGQATEGLAPLRYADDDAAAMAELGIELGAHATVLTVLDVASQRRFSQIAALARPPTRDQLRRAVQWHRDRFEADQRAGDDPVLLLFYSGHGSRGSTTQGASLALLDGALTTDMLHDDVLAVLPARYVHVVVDACHAEAVVRPRDLDAVSAPVTPEVGKQVLARSSLARFPHVGAVIASTSGTQSHEWDVYQRGVFTHELLSAVRGAADVNGDGRIEYSEIHAFLSAANREIADPRARPSILVHPPAVNGHTAFVDLAWAKAGARLVGAGGSLAGSWAIEDERGARLADLLPEAGYRFALLVPAGRLLFIRGRDDEAQVIVPPGGQVRVESLERRPRQQRERGAVETALQRGLFATPFGPTYYRGFVDSQESLVSVRFEAGAGSAPPDLGTARRDPLLWGALGTAAALTAVSATFSLLAWQARGDVLEATFERPASEARDQLVRYRAVALASGLTAAGAAAMAWWRWPDAEQTQAQLLPELAPGHAALTLRWLY